MGSYLVSNSNYRMQVLAAGELKELTAAQHKRLRPALLLEPEAEQGRTLIFDMDRSGRKILGDMKETAKQGYNPDFNKHYDNHVGGHCLSRAGTRRPARRASPSPPLAAQARRWLGLGSGSGLGCGLGWVRVSSNPNPNPTLALVSSNPNEGQG